MKNFLNSLAVTLFVASILMFAAWLAGAVSGWVSIWCFLGCVFLSEFTDGI